MSTLLKNGRALVMALLFAAGGMVAPALAAPPPPAGGPSAMVAVPSPTPGGGGGLPGLGIAGCYTVSPQLYGPYNMSFCLGGGRGSTYHVIGGGLNCNGNLNWSTQGRNVSINLQRSTCGRGQDWSADRMSCTVVGFVGAILPKVVVPSRPGIPGFGDLNCTYYPSERGYHPMTVRARRS